MSDKSVDDLIGEGTQLPSTPSAVTESMKSIAVFNTPFGSHLIIRRSSSFGSRTKAKRRSRPMSLTTFHRSPNIPQSPLEEIENSPNINATIRDMISPQRIESLVKRRPCLVLDVISNSESGNSIYILLPVTHFDGKSILKVDIPPDKKRYTLPIAPNTMDILNRPALETIPRWPDDYSYQLIAPTRALPNEVLSRDGRQTILPERELKRIQAFLKERGDFQRQTQSQYATEQTPIPVHLTPGITKDADSSATLDYDVKVINMLIDGIVEDKKAGGNLLEEVWETLDDSWVTVGPRGRPLRVPNTSRVELDDKREPGGRGYARAGRYQRGPRRPPTSTVSGGTGPTTEDMGRGRGTGGRGRGATRRGGLRSGPTIRVESTGGGDMAGQMEPTVRRNRGSRYGHHKR